MIKKLKYDYGWENGVILHMAKNLNVPFIHIWYRTKKMFYMWEIKVNEEDVKLATHMKLLLSLKNHIDHYFYVIDKTKKAPKKKLEISDDFQHFIDSIYFIVSPTNDASPTPESKYWTTKKK